MTAEAQDWFDPSAFVEGSEKLTDLVGEWPSFDDAEIIRLVLDRSDGSPWKADSDAPTLSLTVRLAEAGYFLAAIKFNNVRNVELKNFSYQNSIQEITFEEVPERTDSGDNHTHAGISAEIMAHCGLIGKFEFQSAVVLSVVPCDRDGRVTPSASPTR